MILYFVVDKVAETRFPAFVADPADPGNTKPLGANIQELRLEVIPDEMRGGKGFMVVQLMDDTGIGKFTPGQRVKVEMTVEG